VKGGVNDGEKRFKQLTIEERVKFDEETLVNVNNIRRKSKASQEASGFSNEYMVVRLLNCYSRYKHFFMELPILRYRR